MHVVCRVVLASKKLGAELDRGSFAATIFTSQSKGKTDRDTNVVHSLKTEQILERKVDLAVRRERITQQNSLKLRLKLRREVGNREILTLLFERSIKNLNLSDFSYIKQVDGQIMLRERQN